MATEPTLPQTPVRTHGGADLAVTVALLSFAAGSMDALAFLALGEVFTSAMSGNTILLGLAIGQGRFTAASHAAAALVGYGAGVAMASLPLTKSRHGRDWVLGLEGLFLVAFAALWFAAGAPVRSPVLYGLIVLSAVAMGLQGAIGRALAIPGIMTVIFTSTYTAIVGGLMERALAGHRPLFTGLATQQLAALAVYLGSAVFGGFVATHWLRVMPLLPLGAVLVLLAGLPLRWSHLDYTSH